MASNSRGKSKGNRRKSRGQPPSSNNFGTPAVMFTKDDIPVIEAEVIKALPSSNSGNLPPTAGVEQSSTQQTESPRDLPSQQTTPLPQALAHQSDPPPTPS